MAMKRIFSVLFILSVTLLLAASLWGQGKVYDGPDDPAGDDAARREAYMTGNRVLIEFKNTTELSDWPDPDASKWPNTYYGNKMTDGIGLLIGSRVFIQGDTTPVDDPIDIETKGAAGLLDTLYYLQTSYREEQDTDPQTGIEWNLKAVPTYLNLSSNIETPAIGTRDEAFKSTWPVNGWPSTGDQLKWPGEWDGYFGRGIFNADMETYFVANDAQDQEYLPRNTQHPGPWYYPRPGVYIGDKRPDVSIQKGDPWGGLGIRVEQRGFQWSNPQARDCIFWQYTIANISDYNLTDIAFGYWLDNCIGGEGQNQDLAAFDTQLDLAYSWNYTGTGDDGFETGVAGFAFLESPGIPWDNRDNDTDGILNERRDNLATTPVGPTEQGPGEPYYDLEQFKLVYGLEDDELREHWDADEDQDWNDGEDANGNGVYDLGEYPGDDVGTDGVAPGDLNYTGPDADGTECDHRPSMNATGCEPDFGETDISESDMLGLTMFRMLSLNGHGDPTFEWFQNDRPMYTMMAEDSLNPFYGTPTNLAEIFASGMFPLYQGRQERISMAQLYAYDSHLTGEYDPGYQSRPLIRLKGTVQIIYNRDYRFAQPPLTPTLVATPGDGQVILTWDNRADQLTIEPFLNRKNDFEGYKLYRATDKKMSDPLVITDGFGTAAFSEPVFQCDKVDGIVDFASFGQVNGQGYYLGDDTGLAHSYIDDDVQNGRTYYYVLVSYDYGIHPDSLMGDDDYGEGEGISPAESPYVIDLDPLTEEITRRSINVAIATPRVGSAGYSTSTSTEVNNDKVLGSGSIEPEVVAKDAVKDGHVYAITFQNSLADEIRDYNDHGGLYVTSGMQVYDTTAGYSLVYNDVLEELVSGPSPVLKNSLLVMNDTLEVWHIAAGEDQYTGIFDGIRLNVSNPLVVAEYNETSAGWLNATDAAEPNIYPTIEESLQLPWTYQIIFGEPDDTLYTSVVSSVALINDETGTRIPRADILKQLSFNFKCINTCFLDTMVNADGDTVVDNEHLDILVVDQPDTNGILDGVFNIREDRIVVGPVNDKGRWAGTVFLFDFIDVPEESLPKPGDVYELSWNRPWFKRDTVFFSVSVDDAIDNAALDEDMEAIRVVPNPYVATNVMEPAVAKSGLNQRRRLMFTHIPDQCSIKIFTVSGVLVDEIEVDNLDMTGPDYDPGKGIVHWDLKSKEGLEIAAGMYLYHVKSLKTGKEKLGKFAVIK